MSATSVSSVKLVKLWDSNLQAGEILINATLNICTLFAQEGFPSDFGIWVGFYFPICVLIYHQKRI